MLKLEPATMAKAIARAKTIHPRVRVISADDRVYSVTGSKGDSYTVRFAVANGLKLGECDCKAGKAGMLCFHVAAAAQVNIAVQSMRRQAASAPAAPVALPVPKIARRPAGWLGVRIGNAMIVEGWAV